MKQHILPAIRLTLVCAGFFIVIYPLLVLALAPLAPQHGRGQTLTKNGLVIGYALEGQQFTRDDYFWGRPSAASYNAAASSGSNKGPSNPEYLQQVQARLDTFLVHNPGIDKATIPAELVTASGSGLDPDLSPAGAYVQVKRIAATRHLNEAGVLAIVQKNIRGPLLGIFGTSTVNVLQLNLALDAFTGR